MKEVLNVCRKDATPIALSSPTLFVDRRDGDGDDSKPEVTSSSCGSLLHFEVVPPTPKMSDDETVYTCFNFEATSNPPNALARSSAEPSVSQVSTL